MKSLKDRWLTVILVVFACISAGGCFSCSVKSTTSNSPATKIGAAPGTSVVGAPVAKSGPVRLAPQVIEGGEAVTTPSIPAGSDPHSPTTSMTN
jgi:hypothetical protein